MVDIYKALSKPPEDALKIIQAGNLRGKSDINPQWKIEAITAQFGLCGIGWKFEILDKTIYPLEDKQILLYMTVALFIKNGESWSEPIIGCGGDFIVQKYKTGLTANDEAFKMCLTDALGNAMKNIGVAADVYRGFCDGKYSVRERRQSVEPSTTKTTNNVEAPTPINKTKPAFPDENTGPQFLMCQECTVEISKKVHDYSVQKFGRPLCMNCQKAAAR